MRNLKSASTATDCDSQEARKWRLTDLAHQCVFCGSDQVEAALAAREEKAPVILNIGVCRDCLVDFVLTRWTTVKHQRLVRLGKDMAVGAGEISAARRRARHERAEQRFKRYRSGAPEIDPEAEAEADRKLAAEEERIAREFGMCLGWKYDEFTEDMARRGAGGSDSRDGS